MGKIKVRLGLNGDVSRIQELLIYINKLHYDARNDIFEEKAKYDAAMTEELIKDNNYLVLVALSGNYVIGYLIAKRIIRPNGALVIYVDDLCIDEMYQDLSAGKALMEYVKQYALVNNAARIELNVWNFNKEAIGFYESLGYKTQKQGMEIKLK